MGVMWMRMWTSDRKSQAGSLCHLPGKGIIVWVIAILLMAEGALSPPAHAQSNSLGNNNGISAGTGSAGSGSLSSVGAAVPPDLTVSGSPVTGASGTITLGHSGQTCSATPCTVTAGEVGVNAASGNIEVDLPAANATQNPIEICKADASANTVTITPNGTDKIDQQASFVLTTRFQCARLVDRVVGDWRIIASKGTLAQDLNANSH